MGKVSIEDCTILTSAIVVLNARMEIYKRNYSAAYKREDATAVFKWSGEMTRCDDALRHLEQEISIMQGESNVR